jgi:hypothetical protein
MDTYIVSHSGGCQEWKVLFHISLLSTYSETLAHEPNFLRPPLDLIKGEAEYEVDQICNHWHFSYSRVLQYLIK